MGHSIALDVKDGKIVRIRPVHFDALQSWESLNPWTIEARGKSFTVSHKSMPAPYCLSYKNTIYGPNRVKYPLKRVDFEPGGDPAKVNAQNRGKSKFKRITWDEATDIIASEIKRLHEKYGPATILCQMDGHGESKNVGGRHGAGQALLLNVGGYTLLNRNPDSWEGWVWGAKHAWGQETVGKMADHTNVWVDALRNTEMILNWGCDAETTPWGGGGIEMNSELAYWTQDAGIENVFVCPDLNYSAAVHAAKWIPILPNTDSAMLAAISNVWINENTYDKDFVENPKYCVGFDKWKDYVMGNEDGVAKTPEWAAPRCGVPAYTIRALARHWAKKVTSEAISNGGSFIRGPYSSEPARMMVYSLAMQGLGNPGVHQLSYIEVGAMGLPGASMPEGMASSMWGMEGLFMFGSRAGASMGTMVDQFIAKPLYSEAILGHHTIDNPLTWYCKDHCTREEQFVKYQYPIEGEKGAVVHAIWMDSPCWCVCWQGGNRHTESLRDPSIEFIFGEHMTLEDDLLYCDIILPVVHKGECDDINADTQTGMFNSLILEKKCAEPMGESKTDYECCCEIAKKLEKYGGIYKDLYNIYTGGETYEQIIKDNYDSLKDGAKALCSWEKLQEQEYFTLPANPDWEAKGFGGFRKFREDPEKNPLETMTGKIEFESQDLKEHFPDDQERPPVAHYLVGAEGWTHNESLEGSRASKYPLLLISNHPRWREHAQTYGAAWLREIPTCKVRGPDGYQYEPVWLHPKTAAARGIKTGDIVKMYNDRGIVLGGAYVTERIIPGAAYQDHGANMDEIVRGQIDRGGSNNMIAPKLGVSKNCTGGMATSGYLVEVEKLSLDEMEQWKKDYPEAFARKYDPDFGLCSDAWMVD